MFRRLDSVHLVHTSGQLRRRIDERFPGSGLGSVAAELETVTNEAADLAERISQPNWLIRGLVFFGLLFIFGLLSVAAYQLRLQRGSQLTKDPEQLLAQGPRTESSPERTMTSFELNRYLDYASEMLAIMGKVAALYVQDFDDPVALNAASDVQDLTVNLSRSIWQKIVILAREKL